MSKAHEEQEKASEILRNAWAKPGARRTYQLAEANARSYYEAAREPERAAYWALNFLATVTRNTKDGFVDPFKVNALCHLLWYDLRDKLLGYPYPYWTREPIDTAFQSALLRPEDAAKHFGFAKAGRGARYPRRAMGEVFADQQSLRNVSIARQEGASYETAIAAEAERRGVDDRTLGRRLAVLKDQISQDELGEGLLIQAAQKVAAILDG